MTLLPDGRWLVNSTEAKVITDLCDRTGEACPELVIWRPIEVSEPIRWPKRPFRLGERIEDTLTRELAVPA